jgi:hypothetical protein
VREILEVIFDRKIDGWKVGYCRVEIFLFKESIALGPLSAKIPARAKQVMTPDTKLWLVNLPDELRSHR